MGCCKSKDEKEEMLEFDRMQSALQEIKLSLSQTQPESQNYRLSEDLLHPDYRVPGHARGSIRRAMKRKQEGLNVLGHVYEDSELHPAEEKSQEALECIMKAVRENMLFAGLDEETVQLLVGSMRLKSVGAGTDIVAEGESTEVDTFFIVESGLCEVFKKQMMPGTHEAIPEALPVKLDVTYGPGGAFGELALLYTAPRRATVRAATPCRLWTLQRQSFLQHKRKQVEKVHRDKLKCLEAVEVMSCLSQRQMELLLGHLKRCTFRDQEALFTKGKRVDLLYIVESGIVRTSEKIMDAEVQADTFSRGSCLDWSMVSGEDGAQDGVSLVDAVAVGTVQCMYAHRDVCEEIIGSMRSLIQLNCISSNPLLVNLKDFQLRQIAERAVRVTLRSGEWVFHQEDQGADMFIVKGGALVMVDEGSVDQCPSNGVVMQALHPGHYFGEMAVLKSAKRFCGVRSVEDSVLLALSQQMLESVLGGLDPLRWAWRAEALRQVPLLKALPNDVRFHVASKMSTAQFAGDTIIYSEGDPAGDFYVIDDGQVALDNSKSSSETRILRVCQFFGDSNLLAGLPREETARTMQASSLLVLAREEFMAAFQGQTTLIDQFAEQQLSCTRVLKRVSVEEVNFLDVLGLGAFGRVLLVSYQHKSFALKVINKKRIETQKLELLILRERKVMETVNSDLVVRLVATFQDCKNLYLMMEKLMGGEILDYLDDMTEQKARFYVGCVVLALEHLQQHNIVYRDLKPENIMMDHMGYAKLVDFGMARFLETSKAFTICGTPAYMSPEMISGEGHSFATDWWSLGCLVYEMVNEESPFFVEGDETSMYIKTISCSLSLYNDQHAHMSPEIKSLILALLEKDPVKRLGARKGGAGDVKKHPWFRGFDWHALQTRQMKPPVIPPLKHEDDVIMFDWPQHTAGKDKARYAQELLSSDSSLGEEYVPWDW